MGKPMFFIITFVGFFLNFSLAQNNEIPSYGRCTTPNNERALCIVLQDCKYLFNVLLTSPLSQSTETYLRRSQCGILGNKVLICCPDRFREVNPFLNFNAKVTTPPPPAVQSSTSLPQPGACGNNLSNRIYGGNETKIDEFPWMALIEYTKPGNEKGHHCGGSLINTRYVITASHCVNGRAIPTDWKLSGVRLGEWDTTTNPDCEVDVRGKKDCAPAHVDISVERAIPHPNYNPADKQQANDIALLRLSKNVQYSYFISPICLPSSSHLRSTTFDGITMDVSGWGKTENTAVSTVKLKAEVKVVNLNDCKAKYAGPNINIGDTQMCAGGKAGIDSCRGDSGGPLISLDTSNKSLNYNFLAGIVSFGPSPCGLAGWPGVYTRVGAFMDWIQNTIQP